jgi:two-component system invasion response regulator UvrY
MNILIIDPHTTLRVGMRDFFKTLPGSYRSYEATNFESAQHLLKTKTFGLVITEFNSGETKTLTVVSELRYYQPNTPILFYSLFPEKTFALPLLRAGVSGFISKGRSIEELSGAILTVLTGGKYLSREVQTLYLPCLPANRNRSLPLDFTEVLSKQENAVMRLLIQGRSTKQIATSLQLKNNTVSTYKKRIFQKMQVNDSLELYWKISAF